MAIHSRTIAWKIPWTEEPGRLQSMGSQSRTRLSDVTSLHLIPHTIGFLFIWGEIHHLSKLLPIDSTFVLTVLNYHQI